MIDAAYAAFLVTAVEERGAAVRAEMVDDADTAVGRSESEEIFAQHAQAHRIAAGDQFVGFDRWQPI